MAGPLGILAPLAGILQLFPPHLRPHPTSIKHLSVICSHQSLTVKGLNKWDLIASQEHLYTGAFHFKDKLLRVRESNSGQKVSKWGSDSMPCKCSSACYAGRPPVCRGLQSLPCVLKNQFGRGWNLASRWGGESCQARLWIPSTDVYWIPDTCQVWV